MMQHQLISRADGSRFIREQGTKVRRRSVLHVRIRREGGRDGIEAGGYVTSLVWAEMHLEGTV
jgi:predicted PhzF superfamily epimerase YddE/YHI9